MFLGVVVPGTERPYTASATVLSATMRKLERPSDHAPVGAEIR